MGGGRWGAVTCGVVSYPMDNIGGFGIKGGKEGGWEADDGVQ